MRGNKENRFDTYTFGQREREREREIERKEIEKKIRKFVAYFSNILKFSLSVYVQSVKPLTSQFFLRFNNVFA